MTSVSSSQPRCVLDRAQHAAAGLVDELVHHVHLGVDLADLVVGQRRGHEGGRAALHVGEPAVPDSRASAAACGPGPRGSASSEPGWPGGRSRSCQGTRWSSEAGGSHGWCGSGNDIQQNHGSSAPSESSQSTVRSATQSVWYHSRGIGLFLVSGAAVSPPGSAWSSPAKLCRCSGWLLLEPAPVVRDRVVAPGGRVHGLLRALEAAPGPRVPAGHAGVLLELVRRVEARLEVGLAEQRGAVASLVVQVLGDRRRVDGERDAVGHDAVGAHVLAREHGGAGGHAHGVLVVGAPVVDALGGQSVDDRRAGHRAAVAAEAVVALLVGRDEEDVARRPRARWRFGVTAPRPRPVRRGRAH